LSLVAREESLGAKVSSLIDGIGDWWRRIMDVYFDTTDSHSLLYYGSYSALFKGVCYQPVLKAMVGDVLEFSFGGHDVYKLVSKNHFDDCDFSDALLMAAVGQSPYEYTVTEQDAADGALFFSCSVGDHCAGGTQKVQIQIEADMGQALGSRETPVSEVRLGLSAEACAEVQDGGNVTVNPALTGECTEPVIQDDGRYYVSCLSPAITSKKLVRCVALGWAVCTSQETFSLTLFS
jgi:hypothetical protein